MFLLDENILRSERLQLEESGVPVHQVAFDWFKQGTKDENILALLRPKRDVTLFTRDRGFYRQDFCHRAYCVVVLEVKHREVAHYAKRFLRLTQFRTKASRSGLVVRVHPLGVSWYPGRHKPEKHAAWQ